MGTYIFMLDGYNTYISLIKHKTSKMGLDLECVLQAPSRNWVGALQELCMQLSLPLPLYSWERVGGPDHAPIFTCTGRVSEVEVTDRGLSKRSTKNATAQSLMLLIESSKVQMIKPPQKSTLA